MKSLTSRWPEEERGGGEAESPDLLDRITLDGSIVGLDGFRVGLDGSRVNLDGPRGIQTNPDGWLEVIWMMTGEMVLVLVIRLLEFLLQHLWLRLI